MGGSNKILTFLRDLFASEELDEAPPQPEPDRQPAFFRWVGGADPLGPEPAAEESRRTPGFFRWLFSSEELGEAPQGEQPQEARQFLGGILHSEPLERPDSAPMTPYQAPRSLLAWLFASEDLDKSPTADGRSDRAKER